MKNKRLTLRRAKGLAHAPRHHHEPHASFGGYISDLVFGGHDGLVTTFAVVSGAAGANLSNTVVLILGFANLIADGLSMGLGEYLGRRSEIEYYTGQQKKEQKEIQRYPKEEQQEVEGIFRRWGFVGKNLVGAVHTITRHRRVWVDLMLKYELGIMNDPASRPMMRAFIMFASFVIAGFFPLMPFLFSWGYPFVTSIILSAITMFSVGALRSHFTPLHWWRAGLEVLLIGSIASASAYGIGLLITLIAGGV